MNFPLMKNNILKEDLKKVVQYLNLKDPILTSGKKVLEFEKKWSQWLGVKYSVFVNSGSSANLISIAILKTMFPKGGEIIVPPLTWISDVSSVIQCGFKPVFADIHMKTLSMNDEEIIKKVNKKTVAVFLTHAQGFNGLSKRLMDFLKQRRIHLIEDVCESHGATYKGKRLGSFGSISNFSFYYAHHLSTIEGGMVCTNSEEIYEKARMMRAHGMIREMQNKRFKNKFINKFKDLNPQFIFAYPAYNLRNNEIGAIIGINQIKRLNKNILKRNNNFFRFIEKIDSKYFFKDFDFKGCSNYAFNLILKNKDQDYMSRLMKRLSHNNIEFRRGSAGGGNQLRQPYLKSFFNSKEHLKYKVTEHVHFFGMYLGNYPSLKKNEIDHICKIINKT